MSLSPPADDASSPASAATPAPLPLGLLFRPPYLGPSLMLGGGIGLHAIETYVSMTVIPSMVRDIGGLPLIAWTMTMFIACSVLGSVFIAGRPAGMRLASAYRIGALALGLGSAAVALAPVMEMAIAARGLQGFGAGILVTLGYAFIRHVYPEGLWNKASTFYAALWGISTFIGPTIGGLFSAGSLWRLAFALPIPFTLLMVVFCNRYLPPGEDDRSNTRLPFLQIALLVAAVLIISLAGSAPDNGPRLAQLLAGGAAALLALLIERRGSRMLLPEGAVFLSSPIFQTYAVMLLLMVSLAPDIFVPYFLQVLHRLPPIVAGYLVGLVAFGWTCAAFVTSAATGRRAVVLIVAGAVVTGLSNLLLIFAIGQDNPQAALGPVMLTGIGLFGMGAGTGLGWAHLVTLLMRHAPAGQSDKASAGITLMQSLGSGFGAALAGVVVNASGLVSPGGTAGAVSAAAALFAAFILPAALALAAGLPLLRR